MFKEPILIFFFHFKERNWTQKQTHIRSSTNWVLLSCFFFFGACKPPGQWKHPLPSLLCRRPDEPSHVREKSHQPLVLQPPREMSSSSLSATSSPDFLALASLCSLSLPVLLLLALFVKFISSCTSSSISTSSTFSTLTAASYLFISLWVSHSWFLTGLNISLWFYLLSVSFLLMTICLQGFLTSC